MDSVDARLVGPLSIDRYITTGVELAGGGALNMAYHWAQSPMPFELISRVASDRSALFTDFLRHNTIRATPSLLVPGAACSVDVRIATDRQPAMDNFVEGVLADFALTDDEVDRVTCGTPAHLVLVDVIDAELHRLASDHRLDGARLTGDFLSGRHFTPERFEATLAHLELGVMGWPGQPDDGAIDNFVAITERARSILVLTFGAHGVKVIDARGSTRHDHWFDVTARPVVGTTIGCGDAFIAAFLEQWFRHGNIAESVDAGRELGAATTQWETPLPASAYR